MKRATRQQARDRLYILAGCAILVCLPIIAYIGLALQCARPMLCVA